MKDTEISNPEELDAELARRATYKSETLWKAAEGRSFRVGDVIGVAAGAFFAIVGFPESQREGGSIILLLLGMAIIASTMFRRQQGQINALRDLLKQSTSQAT